MAVHRRHRERLPHSEALQLDSLGGRDERRNGFTAQHGVVNRGVDGKTLRDDEPPSRESNEVPGLVPDARRACLHGADVTIQFI